MLSLDKPLAGLKTTKFISDTLSATGINNNIQTGKTQFDYMEKSEACTTGFANISWAILVLVKTGAEIGTFMWILSEYYNLELQFLLELVFCCDLQAETVLFSFSVRCLFARFLRL